MKNTVLILAFFMCFLGCAGLPTKSASEVRFPVTSEVVDLVLENEKNQGELPRLYVFGQDNQQIHNNPTNIEVRKEPVYDQNQQEGNSNKIASNDGQNLKDQNIPNNLPSPSSVSTTYPENQQQGNYLADNRYDNFKYQQIPIKNDVYWDGGFPDTTIERRYSIDKDRVIVYIKDNNRSLRWDIEPLITIYINEAREEGINPYLAIAQMLHRTNFLRNEQLIKNHNYAGLANIPGEWNGIFPRKMRDGRTEGVRAHIQHLKGYSSRNQPKTPIVDPRFKILERNGYIGKAKTLEQLYGWWVPAPNSRDYINSVRGIINEMYLYQ
jgi:hypothetical protein